MLGRLHLITDLRFGRDPLDLLPVALGAGVEVVQVRAKDLRDRAALDLASQVVALCAEHGATCIVDDRLDVALAAGAAGVHLGAEDLPVAVARRLAGADFVIGATARDPISARAAVRDGASYLGVGPSFATETKAGLPAPIGPEGVRAVSQVVDVPVIAIGGVRPERVPALLAAGAHGVAVVDAVSGAPDPAGAVRALLERLDPGRLRAGS